MFVKENFVWGIDTNDIVSWVSACQTSPCCVKKKRVRSFNEEAILQTGMGVGGLLGNLYSHFNKIDTIHGLCATTEKLEFPYFKANDLPSFKFILRSYVTLILLTWRIW